VTGLRYARGGDASTILPAGGGGGGPRGGAGPARVRPVAHRRALYARGGSAVPGRAADSCGREGHGRRAGADLGLGRHPHATVLSLRLCPGPRRRVRLLRLTRVTPRRTARRGRRGRPAG